MLLLKKIGAVLSICLFVLMLIRQTRLDEPGYPGYAIGRLAVVVIALAGLFYSTRWLLILSGRKHKVGLQAFATLWCVESVLGVLLGFTFVRGNVMFGSIVIVLWSISFWLTYRWLSRLRVSAT
jgi:hypothetical protein